MARSVDQQFFQKMEATKAVIRLIGPRRIGKTDLVAFYGRKTGAPILSISVPTIPADISPSGILVDLLNNEIAALAHHCPKLSKEYNRMIEKEAQPEKKQKFAGELTAKMPKVLTAKLSASKESRQVPPAASKQVDVAMIGPMLRRLEYAAGRTGLRPVVVFDEVQELVIDTEPQMSAVWAIRNEVQHHTHCRYVFAGSNQKLFSRLQEGSLAPLLNLGSAIEIQPLGIEEIDRWAVPLFVEGKRHVRTLEAATRLLGGKIGEVADVFDWLWSATNPGDLLETDIQERAVKAVAQSLRPIDSSIRGLTKTQTAVLRWILFHPGDSVYSIPGMKPGSVRTALQSLVESGTVECYGRQYAATTPLQMIRNLEPTTLPERLR